MRHRNASAVLALATVFLAACGSDATGPGSLDSRAALQSLALGLSQFLGAESPTTEEANATLSAIAPVLHQATVTIDGSSQSMYAIGFRQSFPEGTCEETLLIDPLFPPQPGVCTPPALEVELLLWQSHSASQPPDRLILVSAEVGTTNFDVGTTTFDVSSQNLPGDAFYAEGQDKIFISESGTLSSSVVASNQTCSLPLPPYAKSGTCSYARFTEQGSIVFSDFSLNGTSNRTVNLVIPSITLDGLWLAITEVKPLPLAASVGVTPRNMPRSSATLSGR